MRHSVSWGLCVLFLLVSITATGAQTESAPETLPDITVIDSAGVTTPGQSVLSKQTLQSLPQGDGAITDLLKVLPGIQFSETDNSSLTGGEILPSEISISGGRVYDNSFLIDGFGNNSLIDPTSDNPASSTDVPGHSQQLFLDTSLVESITVYRSNISARYSGFTGGVIDVETRDPENVFGGEIFMRSTRSEWTSFHVDRDYRDDFYSSKEADMQPEFRKYYGNTSVDVPLTENMGILLAYSKSYSQIPLKTFDEKHNQHRVLENYFAKYVYKPHDDTALRITFKSTPYEGRYFHDDVKNSDYSIDGGGWSLTSSFEQKFSLGTIEWQAGYTTSENSRRAPDDYFNYQVTPSADWGGRFSREGGFGDAETEEDALSLACHATWTPFTLWGLNHEWISGVMFERTKADYHRSYATNSGWRASDSVVCDEVDPFCIKGEQYAWSMVIFPEDDADAEISSLDLYLEDTLSWWRLAFRPGIHVSYNDLMKNTDYAGRGALFYDVFADGSTIFTVGASRYYGKTLLTYALNEEKAQTDRQTRTINADGTLTAWDLKTRTLFSATRLTDLETPYVDEWSLGLEQDVFGGRLTLCYIDRNGEDQLTKKTLDRDEFGYTYMEWTNLGESRHKEVTLSWSRQWENQSLLIDGTWQDSENSNEDYDNWLDIEDFEDMVWYEDHLVYRLNLPRADYNREWSANLIYQVKLDHGFTFTNVTRYRSGYEGIVDSGERHELEDGTRVDSYEMRDFSSSTIFDWKLEWTYDFSDTQLLTATFDIYNVFNRKIYTGTPGEYKLGRQLWVGLTYKF
ncbi:TonB-dependent receptor plug domain-containing protein [uncultured Desulfuromonas sp.]|uniref:TonB-dependent receptor plug domain-containing protein n=1 Tax=uncultured Desulfuromonas sp. TaxID=181013 RepID=UPI002AABE6CC|nr:TonB-dependent receptor plug domain-containing protein [uncultured Desulfuromonas sp.]